MSHHPLIKSFIAKASAPAQRRHEQTQAPRRNKDKDKARRVTRFSTATSHNAIASSSIVQARLTNHAPFLPLRPRLDCIFRPACACAASPIGIYKASPPPGDKGQKKKCRPTTLPTRPNHQTCHPFTRLAPLIPHRNFKARPTTDICSLRRLATRRDHHTRLQASTLTRARYPKTVTSRPFTTKINSSCTSTGSTSNHPLAPRFPCRTVSRLETRASKVRRRRLPTRTLHRR